MKIPKVGPSLNQKVQNCFWHPQIYSSIAPMSSIGNTLDLLPNLG